MEKTHQGKLEEAAKVIGFDKMYVEFFSISEILKDYNYCMETMGKEMFQNEFAKELCNKFVYALEKIAEEPIKSENIQYCNYLRYWLYGEIGKINTRHSKIINEIPFVTELYNIVNKVIKGKLKQSCTALPSPEKNVNLDEWNKRNISYIYFQNHDRIKEIINLNDENKCSEYLAYVKGFNSLYKKYKANHCSMGFSWFFTSSPHYFNCTSTYNPEFLISKLEECKYHKIPKLSVPVVRTSTSGKGNIFKPGADQVYANQKDINDGEGDALTRENPVSKVDTAGAEDPLGSDDLGKEEAQLDSKRTGNPDDLSGTQSLLHLPVPKDEQNSGGQEVTPEVGIWEDTMSHIQYWNNEHRINQTNYAFPYMLSNSNILFKRIYDVFKSIHSRHIIMSASILCVIIFLVIFFKFTGPGSISNKKEKMKRDFENNYNDEYEEELSKYMSEEFLTHSQNSAVHLSYQPRRDYFY
ncbi:variable surface protein [Plasmodium gonderi]|uniref:Variable surface protein n=1 Tax=Plasmodium gonderi TaxID=77519 RepID=A0A1Y1JPK8_PLAGO|nr:variable surface protein [Plasmodium gonderi]GAW84556.1 variable surface protein [Plasmodium gonderi]